MAAWTVHAAGKNRISWANTKAVSTGATNFGDAPQIRQQVLYRKDWQRLTEGYFLLKESPEYDQDPTAPQQPSSLEERFHGSSSKDFARVKTGRYIFGRAD